MANVVGSVFSMLEYKNIYNPTSTMKFAIAAGNLNSAVSTVTAWCNFSSFVNQLSYLTNFRMYENYIRVFGRTAGMFFSTTWKTNYECIKNGVATGNGHDVGYCVSQIATAVLDSVL